jgi:hypothetical protein
MNLEISRQFFEKFSNVEFHENPLSGSRVVPCGQTDRRTDEHDEANSRLSQFALAPKNVSEEEEHSHFRYKVPRPVDVLPVMDKVAPGQVFHGLLSVFLVSVISPVLHTHISLSHYRHHISY